MKTDLIKNLLAREGSHIEEGWVKDVPMGRLGHPSELQGAAVWMASDASSYLNGSDIVSVFQALVSITHVFSTLFETSFLMVMGLF